MKIKFLIFVAFLIFTNVSNAQDDTITIPIQFKMAAGFEVDKFSYGTHLFSYYKGLIFGVTYILPRNSTQNGIKEINNGFTAKIAIAPVGIVSSNSIMPIYIGFGYSFINEANEVLDFTGKGNIVGYHYFIGLRFVPDKSMFWKSLGAHLEFGYSSWNYDDSILKKNISSLDYNYSKFFFSTGFYYFFL